MGSVPHRHGHPAREVPASDRWRSASTSSKAA
jgi:hypothetical protein